MCVANNIVATDPLLGGESKTVQWPLLGSRIKQEQSNNVFYVVR
jgi:hypothetical protein